MAAEGLRMATAMIAMDVMPQILFTDDGVYCLLKTQEPQVAGLISFRERLKTLTDLVGLHAASTSLTTRRLKRSDLDDNYNVKSLSSKETIQMISQNRATLTF